MAKHHLSPRLEAALRRQERAVRERADREEAGQARLGLSPVVEPEEPRLVIKTIDNNDGPFIRDEFGLADMLDYIQKKIEKVVMIPDEILLADQQRQHTSQIDAPPPEPIDADKLQAIERDLKSRKIDLS